MKTYSVSVVIGAAIGGFEYETNDLKEVEMDVNEYGNTYNASVRVWDEQTQQFIYWKDVLNRKPRIDMLHDIHRDFRFRNRKRG